MTTLKHCATSHMPWAYEYTPGAYSKRHIFEGGLFEGAYSKVGAYSRSCGVDVSDVASSCECLKFTTRGKQNSFK